MDLFLHYISKKFKRRYSILPDEAQLLEYVFSMNFRELLISLVILAVCILGIYALVLKIQEITGFETKTMKKRRLIEQNIKNLSTEIDSIKTKQKEQHQEVTQNFNKIESSQQDMIDAIKKLTNAVEKNQIEDNRWTILDFANAVRNNRKYDIEAYNHILQIYDTYEQLLSKNGLENGRVDMAIKLIKDKYDIGQKQGFPV